MTEVRVTFFTTTAMTRCCTVRKRQSRRRMKLCGALFCWISVLFSITCCVKAQETSQPTERPSVTTAPTSTASPTIVASPASSPAPTTTLQPTNIPTTPTTQSPSTLPITMSPTLSPQPTVSPMPSSPPTTSPNPTISAVPTEGPSTSFQPTSSPAPSASPTASPQPTVSPAPTTAVPSASPTQRPTSTRYPTVSPQPSSSPTSSPAPTDAPSLSPMPTVSSAPTQTPTTSSAPTMTAMPSSSPSTSPTGAPSTPLPTGTPSASPTNNPTQEPTSSPSASPSMSPTVPIAILRNNIMVIEGMSEIRVESLVEWMNITTQHITTFWNTFESDQFKIRIASMFTEFDDQEGSRGTTEILYSQRINYFFNATTGLPGVDITPETVASRPFTHDFQRYADSLWKGQVVNSNFLTLQSIVINGEAPKNSTGKVVGIILGVTAGIVLLVAGAYYYRRRKKLKDKENQELQPQGQMMSSGLVMGGSVPPTIQEDSLFMNPAMPPPQDVSPPMSSKPPSHHHQSPQGSQQNESEVAPYSVSATSFKEENVSELSFHADAGAEDDVPNHNEEAKVEEPAEDEFAPAFAMQITSIDDLEDLDDMM